MKELRRLAEAGTPPHVYALLPDHAALVDALVRTYGSLGAARDAASLERGRPAETRQTVIASLRTLSGRAIRLVPRTLRQLGEDQLVRACYDIFGSLPKAREAAGLAAPGRQRRTVMPIDEVLAALVRLAGNDRSLRGRDIRGLLAQDARHHFGTLSAAMDAAGLVRLKPNQRWTRETLLTALAQRQTQGLEISWRALARDGRNDLIAAIHRHLDGKVPGVQLTLPVATASGAKSRRPRPARRRAAVAVRRLNTEEVRRGIGALVAAFVARLVGVAVGDAHRQVEQAFTARLPKQPVARERSMITVRGNRLRRDSHAPSSMALDPIRLHAVLSRVTARHQLSPREALVLAAMVHGIPRSRIAQRVGTGENTVKTQVKTLLEKIGKDSLGEAAWWIRVQVEGATPRRSLA